MRPAADNRHAPPARHVARSRSFPERRGALAALTEVPRASAELVGAEHFTSGEVLRAVVAALSGHEVPPAASADDPPQARRAG